MVTFEDDLLLGGAGGGGNDHQEDLDPGSQSSNLVTSIMIQLGEALINGTTNDYVSAAATTNATTASSAATPISSSSYYYENGDIIETHWHGFFVFLAYLTSYAGSYTAIRLLEYGLLRSDKQQENASSILSKFPVLSSAIVLGLCAIWSMHFIGMHAVVLDRIDEQRQPVCYDTAEAMSSLLLAFGGVFLGFTLVEARDIFAGPDRVSILKALLQHRNEVQTKNNFNRANRRIHYVALCSQLHWIGLGSLIGALGAIGMHYVGMAAFRGPFRVQWNLSWMIVSIVVGVIGFFVGFWILFRPLHWKSSDQSKNWYYRYAAAAVIALALCAMHFLGMLSVTYVYNDGTSSSGGSGTSMDDTIISSGSEEEEGYYNYYSCPRRDVQGLPPDALKVLIVSVLCPYISFYVEHTISQELRLTYNQLLRVQFGLKSQYSSHHSVAPSRQSSFRSRRRSPSPNGGIKVTGLDFDENDNHDNNNDAASSRVGDLTVASGAPSIQSNAMMSISSGMMSISSAMMSIGSGMMNISNKRKGTSDRRRESSGRRSSGPSKSSQTEEIMVILNNASQQQQQQQQQQHPEQQPEQQPLQLDDEEGKPDKPTFATDPTSDEEAVPAPAALEAMMGLADDEDDDDQEEDEEKAEGKEGKDAAADATVDEEMGGLVTPTDAPRKSTKTEFCNGENNNKLNAELSHDLEIESGDKDDDDLLQQSNISNSMTVESVFRLQNSSNVEHDDADESGVPTRGRRRQSYKPSTNARVQQQNDVHSSFTSSENDDKRMIREPQQVVVSAEYYFKSIAKSKQEDVEEAPAATTAWKRFSESFRPTTSRRLSESFRSSTTSKKSKGKPIHNHAREEGYKKMHARLFKGDRSKSPTRTKAQTSTYKKENDKTNKQQQQTTPPDFRRASTDGLQQQPPKLVRGNSTRSSNSAPMLQPRSSNDDNNSRSLSPKRGRGRRKKTTIKRQNSSPSLVMSGTTRDANDDTRKKQGTPPSRDRRRAAPPRDRRRGPPKPPEFNRSSSDKLRINNAPTRRVRPTRTSSSNSAPTLHPKTRKKRSASPKGRGGGGGKGIGASSRRRGTSRIRRQRSYSSNTAALLLNQQRSSSYEDGKPRSLSPQRRGDGDPGSASSPRKRKPMRRQKTTEALNKLFSPVTKLLQVPAPVRMASPSRRPSNETTQSNRSRQDTLEMFIPKSTSYEDLIRGVAAAETEAAAVEPTTTGGGDSQELIQRHHHHHHHHQRDTPSSYFLDSNDDDDDDDDDDEDDEDSRMILDRGEGFSDSNSGLDLNLETLESALQRQVNDAMKDMMVMVPADPSCSSAAAEEEEEEEDDPFDDSSYSSSGSASSSSDISSSDLDLEESESGSEDSVDLECGITF